MRRPSRSPAENEALAASLAVDAVVANALRAHGHDIKQTIVALLASNDEIGIDLMQFPVDIDLGYMGPDGKRNGNADWEPAGRYRLSTTGLRSISMPITRNARWVGPRRLHHGRSGRCRPQDYGAHIVMDHADWPATMRMAAIGRNIHDIVDHPWLEVEGLVVTDVTKELDQHFMKIWVDEVMTAY